MRQFVFKGRHIDPILAGTKTTTIRAATKTRAVWGDVVQLRCRYDQPPFAYARVLDVAALDVDDITPEIAAADGFGDADELRLLIVETYGTTTELVLVTFALCDAPEPPTTLC